MESRGSSFPIRSQSTSLVRLGERTTVQADHHVSVPKSPCRRLASHRAKTDSHCLPPATVWRTYQCLVRDLAGASVHVCGSLKPCSDRKSNTLSHRALAMGQSGLGTLEKGPPRNVLQEPPRLPCIQFVPREIKENSGQLFSVINEVRLICNYSNS